MQVVSPHFNKRKQNIASKLAFFQPAIDITPTALRREINAIEQKLQELPTTFYTLEEGN